MVTTGRVSPPPKSKAMVVEMVVTSRVSPPLKPEVMVLMLKIESQCRVSPPQRLDMVGP